MKSAQELYQDSVEYENLRNSFSQMMKQYKLLETKVVDLEIELRKLERSYLVRGETIHSLSRALAKATGGDK